MINGHLKGICIEPRCKNLARVRRTGRKIVQKWRRCHKCNARRYRRQNPMRAAFRALKDHAAARGIVFRITFPYFRRFALQTNYLLRKGNGAQHLTVDRKNNLRGYVRGNIQALTRKANVLKQARIDEIRHKAGFSWQT